MIIESGALKNIKEEFSDFAYLKGDKIDFREFQVSIAKKCFGQDSLVVIPTGLGKTIIALFVAAYSLENSPPNSKVIVLAPTRPLINQHFESFQKLLDLNSDQFDILTGQVQPNIRSAKFEEKRVLFYTPQTLRNDIVNKLYDLKNVCLVVFDEAHRAQGDYAYCQISNAYLEQNPDGVSLALTASPGSSKSKINLLCENLHIPQTNIHLRNRSDKDVKKYIKPMKIWKVGVNMTEIMRLIHFAIKNMLQKRLNYLHSLDFIDGKEASVDNTFRKNLIVLNRQLLETIQGEGDKTSAYKSLSVNAQALRLFHMLSLVEAQGLDALLSYMRNLKEEAKKKAASKALLRLVSDYEFKKVFGKLIFYEENSPHFLSHPKFSICRDIILREIEKKPGARILVFAQLRDSVAAITKKLKPYEPTIRARRFVGQSTKSKIDKGLTQKKQIEILNLFKQGKYNVLVSTNVAEEGLDIAECDLVVFFDAVASEIRLIQRKGRTARFREGKVFILYCIGTSDEKYMHISINRLKSMEKNLKKSSKVAKMVEKEREKSKELLKKRGNLNGFISPGVKVDKGIPMHYGIRQYFSDSEIEYSLLTEKYHIGFGDRVGIHILPPMEIIERDKYNSLEGFVEDFSQNFQVAIIVADFIDFQEALVNESKLVKKRLNEISQKYAVQIVPIDAKEEFFVLLNGFNFKRRRVSE